MVERTGRGLQCILKHEYGDIYKIGSGITDPATVMRSCNPPLSKYTLFNALQRLRQQFKSYINAEDPFNHKLRSNQSSLQWWVTLEDDECADVLSVSLYLIIIHSVLSNIFFQPLIQKIFAAVLTSMTDEHTQSTLTWLNSPY